MTRRIQLAILSDSRLFRDALSCRLDLEKEIAVIGAAGTVHDLLVRAGGRPVDVLLVHLDVRSALAAEIVFDVKMLLPASRLVVLGCEPSDAGALRWIEAGAAAWLGDDASYDSLLQATQAVAEGRTLFSADQVIDGIRRLSQLRKADPSLGGCSEGPLSDREREVAQWLSLGLSNKEIARRLGVRQPTVKSHVSRVLRKLGARRRGEIDLRRTQRRNKED